jgi:hypothetical protein
MMTQGEPKQIEGNEPFFGIKSAIALQYIP